MSELARSTGRTKLVEMEVGLFLVRYGTTDREPGPLVQIVPEHGFERDVVILGEPGQPIGRLARTGDCLVVQALRKARLSVGVRTATPGGTTEVAISLERLGTHREAPATRAAAPSHDEAWPVAAPVRSEPAPSFVPAAASGRLQILAHVAHRGDVTVAGGDWVAGEPRLSRIEGFAIQWLDRPADVTLRYAVRLGGRSDQVMQANGDGAFVGTRGKALPLTSLAFELQGPGASRYQLVAEGLFLGSQGVSRTGSRVVLSGPSGRETLVGLRLAIEPAQSAHRTPSTEGANFGEATDRRRMKIFRGSSSSVQV